MKSRLLPAIFCLLSGLAQADDALNRSVRVAPDLDIPVTVQGRNQRGAVVWIASEQGVTASDRVAAAQLARRGYQVWLPDLYTGRFLPLVPSSLSQVPADDIAAVIAQARAKKRAVYLVASGASAAKALEGATRAEGRTRGAVLISPNLLVRSPEAGEDPTYLPVATQTRLPVYVLQGDRSPWFWQLDTLKAKLEQGGSQVRIKPLPGMRDRFYFREDAFPAERELGAELPELIDRGIRNLPCCKIKDTQ